MVIPLLLCGSAFPKDQALGTANIKDIAPTVTALLGLEPAREWVGRSLL